MKFNKYILASMAIACTMALSSCSDDEKYDVYGNPNNLVYINLPNETTTGMPKNTFAYTVYHTPVGSLVARTPDNPEIKVTSTRNATSDIQVMLEVDPSMSVPGYATIPANAGINVTLESNTLTIPAGSNQSNGSVKVNIDVTNANWEAFTEESYLIPIKITSANGAVPSGMQNLAYVGIATQVKEGMINPDATSIDGEVITDTDGWSGTWNAPAAGRNDTFNMATLLDNNQWSNAYFVANHADKVNEEVINTFDLGKTYDIKGFQLRYYYIYYTVKDATVETSVNGVDYVDQGTLSWSDNGITRTFAFWAPTTVRYIRVTTHSFYGGTGEGTALSDLFIYK